MQFLSKFFGSLCTYIKTKHMKTTEYNSQTNRQVERYDKTIVACLRHYVATHRRDWDLFVQPLTYAYNTQAHRYTKIRPFNLVLTRHHLPQPHSTIPQSLNLMRIKQQNKTFYKNNCLHAIKG